MRFKDKYGGSGSPEPPFPGPSKPIWLTLCVAARSSAVDLAASAAKAPLEAVPRSRPGARPATEGYAAVAGSRPAANAARKLRIASLTTAGCS
jgi:hypothetical protein